MPAGVLKSSMHKSRRNLSYFFKSDREITFVTSLTIRPYDDNITGYFNEIDTILQKNSIEDLKKFINKTF